MPLRHSTQPAADDRRRLRPGSLRPHAAKQAAALSGGSSVGRGDRVHADRREIGRRLRLRALVRDLVAGWLRISEALALAETDIDARRGSILVRRGKGGNRREVGMDGWAWDQLETSLIARATMPVGPLLCIVRGPARRDRRGPRLPLALNSAALRRPPASVDASP